MKSRPLLISADRVFDAEGVDASPGAVLARRLEGDAWPFAWEILDAGPLARVEGHALAVEADRMEERGGTIVPAFLNAHTHLDLTLLGPRAWAPERGFAPWANMIRQERPTDAEVIASAVAEGVRRSVAGGVVGVGDIAGGAMPHAVRALMDSDLGGVSFFEVFGWGGRQEASLEQALTALERLPREEKGVRLGLSPHAPYTVGRRLYRALAALARERGLPISTHLAESEEERRMVAEAGGALRELLEGLGFFDGAAARDLGRGESPVEHLREILLETPFLLAHVNQASDADIEILSTSGASVVYCPRSARCFGHARHFGPHRWRAMREAGVTVALGTDSVVNLPGEPGVGLPSGEERITPLDDLRLLHTEDGVEARLGLELITTAPARALGLDAGDFTLGRGRVAGLVSLRGGSGGIHPVLDPGASPAILPDGNFHGMSGSRPL